MTKTNATLDLLCCWELTSHTATKRTLPRFFPKDRLLSLSFALFPCHNFFILVCVFELRSLKHLPNRYLLEQGQQLDVASCVAKQLNCMEINTSTACHNSSWHQGFIRTNLWKKSSFILFQQTHKRVSLTIVPFGCIIRPFFCQEDRKRKFWFCLCSILPLRHVHNKSNEPLHNAA